MTQPTPVNKRYSINLMGGSKRVIKKGRRGEPRLILGLFFSVSLFHEWVSIRGKERQSLGRGDGKILPLTGLTQQTKSFPTWSHGKQGTEGEK